jgi:hypothetical protein
VVDDSKVEAVMLAIANAAYSGANGDGKIFVTPVDNALDIFTRLKSTTACQIITDDNLVDILNLKFTNQSHVWFKHKENFSAS